MAIETLKSVNVTALDTQPILQLTAGEGKPYYVYEQDDTIAVTASGMASVGSTYRLCRIPTDAILKSVVVDLGIVDSGGATAVFDINLAFSDSAYDGTPSAKQGLIPTTALNGATTTIAAYTAPNKLLGTITAANNAVKLSNQVIFNGSVTGWFPAGRQIPLYQFFGFVNAQGQPANPGGFFDLLFYLSTAAATGAAGSISARVAFAHG